MCSFQQTLSNWGAIFGTRFKERFREVAPASTHSGAPCGGKWGRRDIFGMLAGTLAILSLHPALADELPSHHGQISVEAAWITAAEKGGYSVLRFRLVNDGRVPAHLLGVNTTVADSARILARVDDRKAVAMNSLSVPADEELDLTTNHLWVELGPLRQTVQPGQIINVKLLFLRGDLDIEAHVHDMAG